VDDPSVLRIFRFRPTASEFDATLRTLIIPSMCAAPGIRDLHVARQGPGELGPRIVASVWAAHSDMARAVGASIDDPALHPGYAELATDQDLAILPLDFGIRRDREAPPSILRLLLGVAREGLLDEYLQEARRGTEADIEAGRGPMALYLAADPPERFVTVSVWGDWASIERATGGAPDRPIATRHPELLASWHVEHYEVLPMAGRPPVAAPEDAA
jgi:hypothetical protein